MGGRRREVENQRRRLTVKGKILGRKVLKQVATIVTPDTILRWHRELRNVKKLGRPATVPLAAIHSSKAIQGILECLDLPSRAPPIAPAVDEREQWDLPLSWDGRRLRGRTDLGGDQRSGGLGAGVDRIRGLSFLS
jgi:hypothetical protein